MRINVRGTMLAIKLAAPHLIAGRARLDHQHHRPDQV